MNWFKRHLNWTVILAVVSTILIFVALASLYADKAVEIGSVIIVFFAPMVLIYIAVAWMLSQKNRSMWWLLLWFVTFPIGLIVWLRLENLSKRLK